MNHTTPLGQVIADYLDGLTGEAEAVLNARTAMPSLAALPDAAIRLELGVALDALRARRAPIRLSVVAA